MTPIESIISEDNRPPFDENSVVNSITEISPQDMSSFVETSMDMWEMLAQQQPQQIIVPERSATPYFWAIEQIDENRMELADSTVLYLPIGRAWKQDRFFDDYTPAQIANILYTVGVDPTLTSAMLLEVNTGNKAAYLNDILSQYFLGNQSLQYYLLMEENRLRKIRRKGEKGNFYSAIVTKDKRYLAMLEDVENHLSRFSTPLIFDNRDPLLNRLEISDTEGMPIIRQNNLAKGLVQKATRVYLNLDDINHTPLHISQRNDARVGSWLELLKNRPA